MYDNAKQITTITRSRRLFPVCAGVLFVGFFLPAAIFADPQDFDTGYEVQPLAGKCIPVGRRNRPSKIIESQDCDIKADNGHVLLFICSKGAQKFLHIYIASKDDCAAALDEALKLKNM